MMRSAVMRSGIRHGTGTGIMMRRRRQVARSGIMPMRRRRRQVARGQRIWTRIRSGMNDHDGGRIDRGRVISVASVADSDPDRGSASVERELEVSRACLLRREAEEDDSADDRGCDQRNACTTI